MDQSISAVIGAIIFAAFAAGLAESIGAAPFIIIVIVVIGLVGVSTYQVIKEQLNANNGNNSSK